MKKVLIILVSLCMVMPNLYAQKEKTKKGVTVMEWSEVTEGDDEVGHYVITTTYETGTVQPSRSGSNWTITGGIGTQFYVGDNDWKAKFLDWPTGPAIDLYASKWITPSFGFSLGFIYNPFKGLYQLGSELAAFQTDTFYDTYNSQLLYRQRGHTFNPHINVLFDMDNIILGYNPNRFYNMVLFAGGGILIGPDVIQTRLAPTFNLGLINHFRVYKRLDFILNLRGSVVGDHFDGESRLTEKQDESHITNNIPFDYTAGITAGISYRFGPRERSKQWTNVKDVSKTYTDYAIAKKEIAVLTEKLERSNEEKDSLIVLNQEDRAMLEKILKDPAHLWYHVQFVIDKWDISNRELVNLKYIAQFIKQAPNTMFSLCGYADMQTATPEHNVMLSRNRVNQVFKVLTEVFDVNPKQLVTDYKGGVDLMFYDDNVLSRCVIIKTLEGKPLE